jgi:hypothetical protein
MTTEEKIEKIKFILNHIDPEDMTDSEYQIYAMLNDNVPDKVPVKCHLNSRRIVE